MAAGMFQGLQDAAALKKRFERFGAVFFVAKVKKYWLRLTCKSPVQCYVLIAPSPDCCEHEWPETLTHCSLWKGKRDVFAPCQRPNEMTQTGMRVKMINSYWQFVLRWLWGGVCSNILPFPPSDERSRCSSKHASRQVIGPAQDEYEEHGQRHHHGTQCKVSLAKKHDFNFFLCCNMILQVS